MPTDPTSITKGIEIAPFIDHTLLKPEATSTQIARLCHEAQKYGFATVCVNPCFVPQAVAQLEKSPVRVCTVVGFPLGTSTTTMKMLETHLAVAAGAREIDMVIHVGELKAGNTDYVHRDIQAVVQAAQPRALVKVILETCLLTDAEIIHACVLAKAAGAHFVKTSTGFNQAGATVAHIRIMREMVGSSMGVKAAGGIRDFATAQKMLLAGATRLGTSASVAIVTEAAA
ncbi:deoxyribose-phosphate aldolase [candidate division KSB1 bacterium]|nr:deoxyribose-phosphate aldolase [candidate division KSB1 bacterium]